MNSTLTACLVFLLTTSICTSQNSTCTTAQHLVHTITTYHYNPIPIDDHFSQLVFDHTLELLDEDKLLFSEEDIAELKVHSTTIDDQINGNNCQFLEDITSIYSRNIRDLEQLYEKLKLSAYDLNTTSSITYTDGFLNKAELNDFTKDLIQLETLMDLLDNEPADIETLFKDKVIKRLDSELCQLASKFEQKSMSEVVADAYLQAICFAFDPHSSYLSTKGKQMFYSALSDESKGFGFNLYPRDGGYLEVTDLTPGGAAWNSNQINEGDLILSVRGNNKQLDLECVSWMSFSEFMKDPNLNEATFLIQKKNKEKLSVFLKKETIEVSQNVIESYILETETDKVGYLYLPSFYGETSNEYMLSNGCANDIAKELLKLKKEGITGLIFDLRDNPGGFMLEAIRLAGIFIDYGALAIIHKSGDDPITLKDPSRGVSYKGPMVVLVNDYSASASELFAAAMQDQNRAVIAGSSTFGKATMQDIIPLENKAGQPLSDEFVKLTLGNFYRVTGDSHQNIGVLVDIPIPYEYEAFSFKESDYATALKNSAITKKTYYYPNDALPLTQLKNMSKSRMDTSAIFRSYERNEQLFNETKIEKIPLGFDSLKNTYSSINQENTDSNNLTHTIFEARKPKYLQEIFELNKDENLMILEYINSDLTIMEGVLILKDLIKLNQ